MTLILLFFSKCKKISLLYYGYFIPLLLLLLLTFVKPTYLSSDHSRLFQVPYSSSKEEHLGIATGQVLLRSPTTSKH